MNTFVSSERRGEFKFEKIENTRLFGMKIGVITYFTD